MYTFVRVLTGLYIIFQFFMLVVTIISEVFDDCTHEKPNTIEFWLPECAYRLYSPAERNLNIIGRIVYGVGFYTIFLAFYVIDVISLFRLFMMNNPGDVYKKYMSSFDRKDMQTEEPHPVAKTEYDLLCDKITELQKELDTSAQDIKELKRHVYIMPFDDVANNI